MPPADDRPADTTTPADDGALATTRRGDGPPLVLVHGFTQTGRMWDPIVAALESRLRITTVDAPGHGGSYAVEVDLPRGAELIGAAGGAAAYVGYSMGGRFALHLALAHPELVTSLVLVSTTAGIEDADERADRRRRDEELANRCEVVGVEEFVRYWLQLPLFATLPPEAAAVESRTDNTAEGLASSLRLAGTGTQEPLWGRLGELAMPVLVVAGALDAAYTERATRMAEAIGPNATLTVLPDTGHSVPLERPGELAALIRAWVR